MGDDPALFCLDQDLWGSTDDLELFAVYKEQVPQVKD